MRVNTITYTNNNCFKSVKGLPFLFSTIKANLPHYQDWLQSVGIHTPKTLVTYHDEHIIFEQEELQQPFFVNYKKLLHQFQNLEYVPFGLDANPRNFLGSQYPIFVDFYPFLLDSDTVLRQQFNYELGIVRKRYFSRENVIAMYVIRLFLDTDSTNQAVAALKYAKPILFKNIKTILPREQLRLLKIFELLKSGSIYEFPQFYQASKHQNRCQDCDVTMLTTYLQDYTV